MSRRRKPYEAPTVTELAPMNVHAATARMLGERERGLRPGPGDVLVGERTIRFPSGGWIAVSIWGANVLELSPTDRAFLERIVGELEGYTLDVVNRDNPAAADE